MKSSSLSPLDEPLLSADVEVCKRVLLGICENHQIEVESEHGLRIGRIALDLYRHGVHDEQHLKVMVSAAVGVDFGPFEAEAKQPPG